MEELWKKVGENPRVTYEVSTHGNVRSRNKRTGVVKPLTLYENNYGYYKVYARFNNKTYYLVHRLVAFAFIPNTRHKPMVDHIDGNKKNNNIENLRWATAQENISNPNTQRRPAFDFSNLSGSEKKKSERVPKREIKKQDKSKKKRMKVTKLSSSDFRNLAKGILEVTLPSYAACRSAMSMVSYTKRKWDPKDGPMPNFVSDINRKKNTITIRILPSN